jgi:hypothetical protein
VTPLVRCEFAKMRRLRVGPIGAVLVVGVVALTCLGLTEPGADWDRLLLALATAFPVVAPIPIAVLASRQVDPEHHGNGWLLNQAAGVPPGRLCRAKLVATAAALVPATVIASALALVVGLLSGVDAEVPVARWLAWTAAVAVVNVVLLALHLLLSARVDNQLVGMGVGVLGLFVAVIAPALPAWAAHLTPWGYYALLRPAAFRDDGVLVALTPSYASSIVLGLVAAAVFLLATHHLDRLEE